MFVPNFAYFGFWFWNKLMTKIEFFFKIPTDISLNVYHLFFFTKHCEGAKKGCSVLENKIFLFENFEKKRFGRRNMEIA
jgi:hypothetical protein